MRNIKYIAKILFAAILIWSCEKEAGTVFPGDTGHLVSFASGKNKIELLEADGTEIKIKLQRAQTTGELDVPVIFKSSSTLLKMDDTVFHFANGDAVAYGTIQHPGASSLGIGAEYTVTLSIDEAKTTVSPGGVKSQKLVVIRKLTWKNVGVGSFTSNDIYEKTYEVEVLSTEENPDIYKALGLYAKGYDILFIVDKAKGTAVIPHQEIGLSLFGSDYPKTWLRADACTYNNGVITVTPGNAENFNKWIVEPVPGTKGVWVSSPEVLVLPQGAF